MTHPMRTRSQANAVPPKPAKAVKYSSKTLHFHFRDRNETVRFAVGTSADDLLAACRQAFGLPVHAACTVRNTHGEVVALSDGLQRFGVASVVQPGRGVPVY
jgi:hypothetical protein